MTIRSLLIASAAGLCILTNPGCGTLHFGSKDNAQLSGPSSPANIQIAVMSFADRYLSAMADVYDKVKATAPTREGAAEAQTEKIEAAIGALGNAVNTNPLAGLMDMAILVTLSRETTDEPWARQAFGPEGLALILSELELQEAEIWRVAGDYLNPEQLSQLRQLAESWRSKHPDQRYVAGVRLASFPEAARSNSTNFGLASSIFGLLRLDPFAGLDPAVRQVEESRVLGERVFFYMRHTPSLVSWQAEALYMQMLDAPQVAQALGNTTKFADTAARFTDTSREFADAGASVAASVEKFRAELPAQQATLMEQLNDLVARQRDEALKQASTELAQQSNAALKQAAAEIAAERRAAIDQLNDSVVKQQDLMAQNLQAIMDHSIDRLYTRARSLVLIAIGGLLGAVVLFALIAVTLRRRAPSPGRATP